MGKTESSVVEVSEAGIHRKNWDMEIAQSTFETMVPFEG